MKNEGSSTKMREDHPKREDVPAHGQNHILGLFCDKNDEQGEEGAKNPNQTAKEQCERHIVGYLSRIVVMRGLSGEIFRFRASSSFPTSMVVQTSQK